MLKLLRENRFFIIPYIFVLSIATFFLILFSKSEIHIYLNQYHHTFTDLFFKYATHIGDGLVVALFIIILLFVRYRYSIILFGSVILTTFVVQLFKRVILPLEMRPKVILADVYDLYLVPGVEVLIKRSFPSGHSASAFGIFFMAALISKNNNLKFLFLLIAVLVAYSRVYLSHHFLVDIYAGSLISTVFTFLMFYFGMKWKNKGLDKSLKFNRKKAN